MKTINTQGIYCIDPVDGSREWYWGMDYTSGDLYEAEELFKQGHPIQRNRLIFVHYPDGASFEPVLLKEGQYFGKPVYHEGQLLWLLVDFPQAKINVIACDEKTQQTSVLVTLPLSIAEDCYNLMLNISPLMLTRQSGSRFQILWPHKADYEIGNTESFDCRIHEKLYFSAWYEDSDYREEMIVRDVSSGQVIQRTSGAFREMPDGQHWLLV